MPPREGSLATVAKPAGRDPGASDNDDPRPAAKGSREAGLDVGEDEHRGPGIRAEPLAKDTGAP